MFALHCPALFVPVGQQNGVFPLQQREPQILLPVGHWHTPVAGTHVWGAGQIFCVPP